MKRVLLIIALLLVIIGIIFQVASIGDAPILFYLLAGALLLSIISDFVA